MSGESPIYDAAVVGAGPAGCAAAITMAQKGLEVLLIDQHAFPRDKVCGDGLTGNTRQMLAALGVWEKVCSEVSHYPYALIHPSEGDPYPLNINLYTIRRRTFDHILYQHALELGVTFRQLVFTGECNGGDDLQRLVCIEPDNMEQEEVRTRFIVLTTGSGVIPGDPEAEPADTIGLRGYYRADWALDAPQIIFPDRKYENGYIWIFPMGGDLYNVGCGVAKQPGINLRHLLDSFIADFNRSRQGSGEWEEKPRGAPIRTDLVNLGRSVQGSVLLAGDALGCCFPVTAEGIAKSLESGILAGESVLEAADGANVSGLQVYRQRLNSQLRLKFLPYRLLAILLRVNALAIICRGPRFQKWFIGSIRMCNRISRRLFEKA